MEIRVNEQVYLSELQPDDRPALVEHLNDKAIYDLTLRIPYPYTEAAAGQFLERVAAVSQQQGRPDAWAIRSADGRLIGGIGLHAREAGQPHLAEIGYWLARPYWGRGIATAVVRRVCALAFEEYRLAKVIAHVFPLNAASARVLEKNGFEQEGYLKKHFVKDGQLLDARLFARLA